ncbi:hypothetical protein [Leptospira mtsangambouensis]|uniref:hypothetical protein n=1 Tax=Leptospira mtsangambouensis TaxID=2484912 RepID=UPI001EEC0DDF|nr:hypothetical protein [Leptospira mtsangambouensis]MCG6142672.1 hypothetical protein [Leptospira mtsangambouensis]
MNNEKCALCDQEGLLRNSHIISDTLFDGTYDQLHRIMPIHEGEETQLRFQQQGFREKLLCDKCEQKLSRWENILKKELIALDGADTNRLEIIRENGKKKVTKIAYDEFKKAILSILWRMSICKDPFFTDYKLSKEINDSLKKAILDESKVPEQTFALIVTRIKQDDEERSKIIALFNKPTQLKEYKFISFILYGFLFDVCVSCEIFDEKLHEIILKEDGSLTLNEKNLLELEITAKLDSNLNSERVRKFHNLE